MPIIDEQSQPQFGRCRGFAASIRGRLFLGFGDNAMAQVARKHNVVIGNGFQRPSEFRLRRNPGTPIGGENLVEDHRRTRSKQIQIQNAGPERMDNFSGQLPQAAVAIGVERERLSIGEPSQPPFHPDTFRTGPHQIAQLDDAFFDDVGRRRAERKPERGVVAAHVLHAFRTDGIHGTDEAAEKFFWQSVLEKIYLAHLNVPFLLLGRASERRHKSVVDLEFHDDLPRAPMHAQDLAEFGIEIILQHHRPWFFKKKIGSIRDGSAGQNTQFLAIGNMLHDARHPGDAQLAKGARAMAAVVQDQSILGIDGIEKVAAESDGKADDADEVSRRRIISQVFVFERHDADTKT